NPRLVPSLAGCPRLPPTATSVSLPPAISCPAASIPPRRDGGAARPKGRAQSLSCPARNTSGRRMLAESWINHLLESLLTKNNAFGTQHQQRAGRHQRACSGPLQGVFNLSAMAVAKRSARASS